LAKRQRDKCFLICIFVWSKQTRAYPFSTRIPNEAKVGG